LANIPKTVAAWEKHLGKAWVQRLRFELAILNFEFRIIPPESAAKPSGWWGGQRADRPDLPLIKF